MLCPHDHDNDGTPDALDAFPDDSPWCGYRVRPSNFANSIEFSINPAASAADRTVQIYAVPQEWADARVHRKFRNRWPTSKQLRVELWRGYDTSGPNVADSAEVDTHGGPGVVNMSPKSATHSAYVAWKDMFESGNADELWTARISLMAGAATEESEAALGGEAEVLKLTQGRVPAVTGAGAESGQPLVTAVIQFTWANIASNEEDSLNRDCTESADADGDGVGDNADPDDDNDGLSDADDSLTA